MVVEPSGPLRGTCFVPGDKSVSHRAVLFATLAGGRSRIRGLSPGDDVAATVEAARQLGGTTSFGEADGELEITAPAALQEAGDVVDCGNSGTSIRLLVGALAARPGLYTVLTGDASLRRRPMERLLAPLVRMGAVIDGRDGRRLAPLSVRGRELQSMTHDLPVASAQVKSAILLAGLRCGVTLREPRRSRDHTERMLLAMGAGLEERDGWLVLRPSTLAPVDVDVPGDLSAAAFLIVAALLVPGSELILRNIGVNPTRTGVIDALRAMGADLEVIPRETTGTEPVADIVVRHSPLRGIVIDGELALRCLDELVILSVAAAFAEGVTTVADARELRIKESDRIARVALGLRALGIAVEEQPDGLVVTGGAPKGRAVIDADHDHRIAMAFSVAGLASPGGVEVLGSETVRSSWPSFFEALGAVTGNGPGAR